MAAFDGFICLTGAHQPGHAIDTLNAVVTGLGRHVRAEGVHFAP